MDRPDLINVRLYRWFHWIIYPIIRRYSITQLNNITDQLHHGARYFDIRVALRPEDGQLYICHNFYGSKLCDILEQIDQFVRENSQEVVIIDFQHFHGLLKVDDHKRVVDLLEHHFGGKMMSYFGMCQRPITLKQLWSLGKQVIVIYRSPFCDSLGTDWLCPTRALPNPWPNTTNPEVLRNYLKSAIQNRPRSTMFVSQAVLTPNTGYVLLHLFGTLQSQLARQANKLVHELLLHEYSPKSALYKRMDQSKHSKDTDDPDPFGPNIVMIDFIDWHSLDIVAICCYFNQHYFG